MAVAVDSGVPCSTAVTKAMAIRLAALDILERAIVIILFSRFVWVLLSNIKPALDALTTLLVLAEAVPFICILLRAPSPTLSRRPMDWILGVLGTTFPLLVVAQDVRPLASYGVCLWLMVLGTYVQIAAKVVLGRRFGLVAANRGVVTIGPYRFIRHPMYAGYTMIHAGFLLAMPIAVNALLYALAFGFQILRIVCEERVLKQDPAYCDFAAKVRYRLVPGIF